jgi:hypothetical protein
MLFGKLEAALLRQVERGGGAAGPSCAAEAAELVDAHASQVDTALSEEQKLRKELEDLAFRIGKLGNL